MARALAHAAVAEADKARLRAMLAGTDPVLLLAEIRAAQAELGERVDERGMGASRGETPAPVDLARFAASLKVAWSEGERRPTHRRRYVRRKPLVRPSVLDAVRERIVAWLDEQPSLTAIAVLERLREIDPERFKPKHELTVQRFVKARRAAMAREVLLGAPPAAITAEPTARAA